jgi:hypothetical protein
MTDYEQWRPALIAFVRTETPWRTQTIENLERGDPLTADDKRTIDAMREAFKVAA